ncbi:MAG: MFS transporter [Deltaproteobacteria bacterium]|nr:MFS transporter [Deltaproteobacteria bacterium]
MTDPAPTYTPYRWFVALTLVVTSAAMQTTMIGFAPLMGVIAKDLHIGLAYATGAFMGGFTLVSALSALAGGSICDRFGVPRAYLLGSVLLIAPTLLLPYAGDSFGAVLAVRLLQALGVGPILSGVSPVAATWFPARERPLATGLQGTAVCLGIALGLVGAPALYQMLGDWRQAMVWLSLFPGLGLALTIVLNLGPTPSVACSVPGGGDVVLCGGPHAYRQACRQSALWMAVLIDVFLAWVYTAFNDLTPTYLAVEPPVGVGYGPLVAGKLMMVFQVGAMVGSLAVGVIASRLFREPTRPPIVVGFGLFALFATAIKFPVVYGNPALLMTSLCLAGFFMAWVVPSVLAFIALHYPVGITGKVVGTMFAVGTFGGVPAIFAGALALHRTGNYQLSIVIVAVAALCGIVPALFLKPPRKTSPAEENASAARAMKPAVSSEL